jgi:hypothetical protein
MKQRYSYLLRVTGIGVSCQVPPAFEPRFTLQARELVLFCHVPLFLVMQNPLVTESAEFTDGLMHYHVVLPLAQRREAGSF